MATSLAPSPIARVVAATDLLTSSTTSAFCRGVTLSMIFSMFHLDNNSRLFYRQQMTVRQTNAIRRNSSRHSFSNAKLSVFPSIIKEHVGSSLGTVPIVSLIFSSSVLVSWKMKAFLESERFQIRWWLQWLVKLENRGYSSPMNQR